MVMSASTATSTVAPISPHWPHGKLQKDRRNSSGHHEYQPPQRIEPPPGNDSFIWHFLWASQQSVTMKIPLVKETLGTTTPSTIFCICPLLHSDHISLDYTVWVNSTFMQNIHTETDDKIYFLLLKMLKIRTLFNSHIIPIWGITVKIQSSKRDQINGTQRNISLVTPSKVTPGKCPQGPVPNPQHHPPNQEGVKNQEENQ